MTRQPPGPPSGDAMDVRVPAAGVVLLAAVWFGLVTGLGEVVMRLGQKHILNGLIRTSPQYPWMAPVANVMLFVLAATLLLALRPVSARLRGDRAVFFLFVFLGVLGWVLLPWRISLWAGLVLSAGVAWQGSLWLVRRTDASRVLIRRSTPWLGALVALAALIVNTAGFVTERRALAALPAAREGVPNVILIIWDTVRAASLGLHGHTRPTTPNLERLAARGVTFDRAIATSSWTLPTHASMFTGRLPHQMSAAWYHALDDAHPTIAEALASSGYLTAGFAANTLYVDREHGLARGFAHFEAYRVTPGEIVATSSLGARLLFGHGGWEVSRLRQLLGDRRYVGRKTAEQAGADFLRWLDAQPGDRPFFAFLNLFDAHLPYHPPPPFDTMFEPRRPASSFAVRLRETFARSSFWDMSDEALAAEVAAYEGAIAYLDAQLGALVDALRDRGMLDQTLIIVTSDHGEEFGEHGHYEHGSNLYMVQTHVPLVVALPGRVPEGLRITEPVSLRDIAATLADLTRTGSTSFPGASLARFWGPAPEPGPVIAELAPGRNPDRRMTALVADGFHYIHNIDGRMELYDVKRDPLQRVDLATDTLVAGVLQRLSAASAAFQSCDDFACCCTLPPSLPSAPEHVTPVDTTRMTSVPGRGAGAR